MSVAVLGLEVHGHVGRGKPLPQVRHVRLPAGVVSFLGVLWPQGQEGQRGYRLVVCMQQDLHVLQQYLVP
jgi:hypothetical protein